MGRTRRARRCNLEMRKKLEKDRRVMTGVDGEGKDDFLGFDYAKNVF